MYLFCSSFFFLWISSFSSFFFSFLCISSFSSFFFFFYFFFFRNGDYVMREGEDVQVSRSFFEYFAIIELIFLFILSLTSCTFSFVGPFVLPPADISDVSRDLWWIWNWMRKEGKRKRGRMCVIILNNNNNNNNIWKRNFLNKNYTILYYIYLFLRSFICQEKALQLHSRIILWIIDN